MNNITPTQVMLQVLWIWNVADGTELSVEQAQVEIGKGVLSPVPSKRNGNDLLKRKKIIMNNIPPTQV